MRRVKKAWVSSSAIPSWWSTQPSRVTLRLKVRSPMPDESSATRPRRRAHPAARANCRRIRGLQWPATIGYTDSMVDDALAEDAKAALFDELAHLIERCGIEPFVAAPLLEADDRFFPDE